MTKAQQVKKVINASKCAKRADQMSRYFKTGKGEYGEHDKFLGLSMPDLRVIAKDHKDVNLVELQKLLESEFNEERMVALLIMVDQFKKVPEEQRQQLFDFYLRNTRHVNNWNLVDGSCYFIVGEHLHNKDRAVLYTLAESANLWERRIAIVSTMAFLRKNDFDDTFALAEKLLHDDHDLIHKAVGWLVREAGKRDEAKLLTFLEQHAAVMPRTMLRYAIEKLSKTEQTMFLNKKKNIADKE